MPALFISSWQARSETGHKRSLFTLVLASRRSVEDGHLAMQQQAQERILCRACLLSSHVHCALSQFVERFIRVREVCCSCLPLSPPQSVSAPEQDDSNVPIAASLRLRSVLSAP